MLRGIIIFILFLLIPIGTKLQHLDLKQGTDNRKILKVHRTNDFEITGNGASENWALAPWTIIPQRDTNGKAITTRAKVLYSKKGIYFLFHCEDTRLSAAMDADFMDLWKEDVVEVFLWTDEAFPVYFEYEISPLNYELPILVSNDNGDLVRWQPFHYDANRRTRHATSIEGGKKSSNAIVTGWTAEFFIPYPLLRPLNNVPPKPGTKWRANFYRVDYDEEERISWSWELTDRTFHEYEKFGELLFE